MPMNCAAIDPKCSATRFAEQFPDDAIANASSRTVALFFTWTRLTIESRYCLRQGAITGSAVGIGASRSRAWHTMPSKSQQTARVIQKNVVKFLRPEHPIIRTHPVTRRKALFVNRAIPYILQLNRNQATGSAQRFYRHIVTPSIDCRFKQQSGSVARWALAAPSITRSGIIIRLALRRSRDHLRRQTGLSSLTRNSSRRSNQETLAQRRRSGDQRHCQLDHIF
jgi:hypothetical protein